MKESQIKKLLLVGIGLLLPMLAARAAREVAGRGYHAITRHDPPQNPANPEVEWREAICWTLASGALGGLARMFARRWLASTSVPSEGHDLEDEAEDAGLDMA